METKTKGILEHELISRCPVCKSEKRKLLHDNLRDYFTKNNNYNYTFYLCLNCSSGYYSPRPTKNSIHLLYADYGTHTPVERRSEFSELTVVQKIKRRIANSYTKKRYGTADEEVYVFGSLFVQFVKRMRQIIDASFRFIPPASAFNESILLDFGCGNGGFLSIAKRAGYASYGIDFDDDAIDANKQQESDIYKGDIVTAKQLDKKFDVITISHVIEHVYDPVYHLESFYELLSPGGFLYIETPNLGSAGHKYYKGAWRGLEPPRHISLFSKQSLIACLRTVGFQEIKTPFDFNPVKFICNSTNRNRYGDKRGIRVKSFIDYVVVSIINLFHTDAEEFIYLTARKPL